MNKLQLSSLSPVIMSALLLSGCSDGDNSEASLPPEPSPIEGVWSAPAYGQLYQFGRADSGFTSQQFLVTQRNLPNVTIVGEPSAGRLSDELPRRVTSDIAFSLSNEFYISPTGEWFERTGVPVDFQAPFWTQELLAQERDPGFEQALQLLLP